MDTVQFENLMYDEWKKQTLDRYKDMAEKPYFDLLWDLKDKLYDIFYPLGISSCGIHDVARVASEIDYTNDDGDLSIVAVYTKDIDPRMDSFKEKLLSEFGVEFPEMEPTFSYFVCDGWATDLSGKTVKNWATYHSPDRFLVKYVAKRFDVKVLEMLHGLLPRFEKEKELSRRSLEIENAEEDYYDLRHATEKMIEEYILAIKPLTKVYL